MKTHILRLVVMVLLSSGSAATGQMFSDLNASRSCDYLPVVESTNKIFRLAAVVQHGEPTGIDVSRDGKLIAVSSSDGFVLILRSDTLQCERSFFSPSTAACLSFSKDGRFLAVGHWDEKIRIWDLQHNKIVNSFREKSEMPCEPSMVRFFPDNKRLAVGARHSSVEVWEIDSPKKPIYIRDRREGKDTGAAADVRFDETGDTMAVLKHHGIEIWHEKEPNQFVRTASFEKRSIRDGLSGIGILGNIALSRDGMLLVGCGNFDDISSRPKFPWSIKGESTMGEKTSIDYVWVARGPFQDKGTNRGAVVSLQVNAPPWVARSEYINNDTQCVAMSPDGTLVASGSEDGVVRIWRTVQGNPPLRDEGYLLAHRAPITRIAFCSNERLLTVGADGFMRSWDLKGQPVARNTLWAWSSGGLDIAGLSYDPKKCSWKLYGKGYEASLDARKATRREMDASLARESSPSLESNVRFPNKKWVAVAGKGPIQIRNVEDGSVVDEIPAVPLGSTTVIKVAPDGQSLAVVDRLGAMAVWQLVKQQADETDRAHPPEGFEHSRGTGRGD